MSGVVASRAGNGMLEPRWLRLGDATKLLPDATSFVDRDSSLSSSILTPAPAPSHTCSGLYIAESRCIGQNHDLSRIGVWATSLRRTISVVRREHCPPSRSSSQAMVVLSIDAKLSDKEDRSSDQMFFLDIPPLTSLSMPRRLMTKQVLNNACPADRSPATPQALPANVHNVSDNGPGF